MPREAEHDELVMTLVESALQRQPSDRETFLRSACGGNVALFKEVLSLVASEEAMAGFLAEPVLRPRRSSGSDDAPFEPGELVAGRFRIIRRIGHGGMGVVYEALDEKLDRRIAIKFARVGFSNRLPPEARTASEVSHYNICKVHELHTAETGHGPVDFLTMEFIDGETLAQRLRRLEPVSQNEAISIIRQIAAGMAQAHRQGIVHGDLKPGNVLLARQPDGSVRSVVTDFGLAKGTTSSSGLATSERGGTLDYMAPELLRGARSSTASDIFAFGVMIREIIGPALQKHGKSAEPTPSQSTLTLARTEAVIRERTMNASLPAPWNGIVSRCTASEAEDRYATADDVVADLGQRPQWLGWAIAVTLIAVALASFGLWRWSRTPIAAIRLAVLPVSIDGTVQSPALAGLGFDITRRLSKSNGVIVIPPSDARQYNVKTTEEAGKVLGATHVLSTTVMQRGPDLVAYASVTESGSGRILRELRGTYLPGDTAGLAKAILGTVTGGLQLAALTTETVASSAYADYVQGMALLNRDNTSAPLAVPFLQRAAAADPKSPLPLAALAEAQLRMYRGSKDPAMLQLAEQLAAKAGTMNPDAPEVVLIDGLLKLDQSLYRQAAEAFQRATQLAPGNPTSWNRLALAYRYLQRPADALATFQKAAEVQPSYFRHYLDWFAFHWNRSEYPEAEVVARRLVTVSPGLWAGHANLAQVLMDQGRFQESEVEARESLRLRETAIGNYHMASLHYWQRRYAESIPLFERAMKLARPDTEDYLALGNAHAKVGHSREAMESWKTGLELAEKLLLAQPQQAAPRGMLALLAAKTGDRKRGAYEIAQAVRIAPDDGKTKRNAAETYLALGDVEAAVNALRDAKPTLLAEVSRSPNFEELHHAPGFQQLLQQQTKGK
ncbi:MAG: protein kinase [Bryobacteraceae bacterium]|nr:protein kinase [Bryobacteraceae bacterium]